MTFPGVTDENEIATGDIDDSNNWRLLNNLNLSDAHKGVVNFTLPNWLTMHKTLRINWFILPYWIIFDGQLDDEHFATDQNGMISHSYLPISRLWSI